MKLSTFQRALAQYREHDLAFVLPGGKSVPSHAHVTEVGRTEKSFVDCGGKRREQVFASLQIWVADDTEHRLPAGKLAAIMEQAEDVLGCGDPDMHIPFERVIETGEVFTRMGATVDVRRYPGMPHTINHDEIDACRTILRRRFT